jgi:hypothetical protein
MTISGFMLWLAQRQIPIGTAYAVWTGIGAAETFVTGIFVYEDPTHMARYLGFVDVSAQPQQNRSEGQHFHEMAGFLLIAGGNTAKVFEFAEHAFDDMTLLLLVPVTAGSVALAVKQLARLC